MLGAERAGHARAVLAHVFRRVAGADPAVEAGIESAGRAAVPGEEGMADVWRLERGGAKHDVRHARKLVASRRPVKPRRQAGLAGIWMRLFAASHRKVPGALAGICC